MTKKCTPWATGCGCCCSETFEDEFMTVMDVGLH
jgi:hypothetical protein